MDIMDHVVRAEVHQYALETFIHYHLSVEGGRYKLICFSHEDRLAGLSLILVKQVEAILYVKHATIYSATKALKVADIAPISFENGSYVWRTAVEVERDKPDDEKRKKMLSKYVSCEHLRVNKKEDELREFDLSGSGVKVEPTKKRGEVSLCFKLGDNPYLFILWGESPSRNDNSMYHSYPKGPWTVTEGYLWEFDRILWGEV